MDIDIRLKKNKQTNTKLNDIQYDVLLGLLIRMVILVPLLSSALLSILFLLYRFSLVSCVLVMSCKHVSLHLYWDIYSQT